MPEVGVKINEEDKSKNGGLNFQNTYGRMSVKQYEKIRAYYMGKNYSQNPYKQPIIPPGNSNMHLSKIADQNLFKVDEEKKNKNEKNKNDASELMAQNWKISNYNWDNVDYSFNNLAQGFQVQGLNPNDNKVINNENLFKPKKYNVKRNKYNKNSENTMNKFNGKLMSNADWGNSPTNKIGLGLSRTVPLKKDNIPNLRTRRK